MMIIDIYFLTDLVLTKEERETRHNKRRKKEKNTIKAVAVIETEDDSNSYKNQILIQRNVNFPISSDELKQMNIHHKSFIEFATDTRIRYFASRPHVSVILPSDYRLKIVPL